MTQQTVAPALLVRPLAAPEEYRAAQELQTRAWGITTDGYVMPVSLMVSVQHTGGLALGAFQGARLVGFSLAYLGRVQGEQVLFSQLTAVDPALQSGGVGSRLKTGQRQFAHEQGIAIVAWTFDPLQSGNANFNIHRLRATASSYHRNFYGERRDALNHGLPTDRLMAMWRVDGNDRHWRDNGHTITLLGARRQGTRLEPEPAVAAPSGDDAVLITIVREFGALKAADPELARTWQQAVGQAFEQAFQRGLVVMDFRREGTGTAVYELRAPLGAAP